MIKKWFSRISVYLAVIMFVNMIPFFQAGFVHGETNDLIKPSTNLVNRGVIFKVTANEKQYSVTFNDQNKLLFLGTSTYSFQLNMPTDQAFHDCLWTAAR